MKGALMSEPCNPAPHAPLSTLILKHQHSGSSWTPIHPNPLLDYQGRPGPPPLLVGSSCKVLTTWLRSWSIRWEWVTSTIWARWMSKSRNSICSRGALNCLIMGCMGVRDLLVRNLACRKLGHFVSQSLDSRRILYTKSDRTFRSTTTPLQTFCTHGHCNQGHWLKQWWNFDISVPNLCKYLIKGTQYLCKYSKIGMLNSSDPLQ